MASRSGFEKWFQQPVLRSAPPGPPSRQWLARQPKFSTTPAGLEAVAGLPTQGPAEEELAPLPPSRSAEPLPRGRIAGRKQPFDEQAASGSYLRLPPTSVSSMAPGQPFGSSPGGPSPIREPGAIGGERVLSTLRPGGIGLLGETEQEMNERLNREEAAEAVLQSPGLIKAVGLNQMTLPAAISAESAERKHGEDRTKAEKEALEKVGKLQTQQEAMYDRAFDVITASGVELNEARRQATVVSNLDSSAGRQVLQDIRAATEKKSEREAKEGQRERLALTLPGAQTAGQRQLDPAGEIASEPRSVEQFRAGGTYSQAEDIRRATAVEKRRREAAGAPPKPLPKSAPVAVAARETRRIYKDATSQGRIEIARKMQVLAASDRPEAQAARDFLRSEGLRIEALPSTEPPAPPESRWWPPSKWDLDRRLGLVD